jgi:hypothetical protein
MPPRIDVHQHVWTEPLVAALARRWQTPRLRREHDGWRLELDGEPPGILRLDGESAGARAELVAEDGLALALVCLSSPLGIEALPAEEAEPLLDAYHEGAFALPSCFGVWGALAVQEPDPDAVDALLARGAIGVSLPAGAISSPAALERLAPVLERLDLRGVPLLVHPGPGPSSPRGPGAGLPDWWPAMTDYVAEQAAAWHAFAAEGRRIAPSLRVVFAMLAGGAPLHGERLRARGGPLGLLDDPDVFYDISSYGRLAVRATAAAVGWRQLVYGSDRPVVDPGGPPAGVADELLEHNPARALGLTAVAA